MADAMTPGEDKQLQRCLQQFRSWDDNGQQERELSQQCRDYYDGDQLTEEEIATLQKRGQPPVVSNRIKPKVDSLIGFERSGRTDPKAYPRTPRQETDADTATDSLRYVAQSNDFDTVRSDCAENLFIEGTAAAVVNVVPKRSGQFDVSITQIPWDRFYRDPYSRRRDFSDAKFLGTVLWMDEDDVLDQFPGSDEVIELSYGSPDSGDGFTGTYEDRPKFMWGERGRRRVRVLQHRWREKGVWMTATLCFGGFLRKPQESPYLDEDGNPECDIVAVSCFVDRQNRRYGIVKQMLSPQDEINKRRSKALHRLAMRQIITEKGAVDSIARTRAELARPDGVIVRNPDRALEIVDGFAAMQGELALLQESKAEIDSSGVNPSLEGDMRAPSGRAAQVQQQAGLREQAVPFDALKMWSWRVYRAAWNRVRQFWTDEQWIRVTDDEKSLRWVQLNHPVTAAEEVQRYVEAGQQPPTNVVQAFQANPETIIRYENSVAELDVDIIIEDGPDTVTIQGEQFQMLVELKKADPGAIPTEMVIQASSLRNKDRILEAMQQGKIDPQQVAQMQKELQETQQKLAAAEAQLADKQIDAQQAQADTALDAQRIQTEQFQAVTDRMTAISDRERATREAFASPANGLMLQ